MNTTIKSIGISGLAALLIFGMEALAHSADKIGYINPQRIISESNIGKKKTEEYNRLREQKDKELRGKLAEIEALNNDLKKEREQKTINERKIKDLIEQIQNKNKEIERYAADVKEGLAKKDVESVNEILLKAAPILNDIGNKRGYAVILKNIQDIAYIEAGVDITGEVIKRLNETK